MHNERACWLWGPFNLHRGTLSAGSRLVFAIGEIAEHCVGYQEIRVEIVQSMPLMHGSNTSNAALGEKCLSPLFYARIAYAVTPRMDSAPRRVTCMGAWKESDPPSTEQRSGALSVPVFRAKPRSA